MDEPRLITTNADDVNTAYLRSLAPSKGVVFERLQRFVAPRHQDKIRELRGAGETRPTFKALDHMGDIFYASYPDRT